MVSVRIHGNYPPLPLPLPFPLPFPLPGCLLQFLRQRKELVEKTELILDMAVQIGSAMYYLEKNGFIHRDLVRGR